jgi:Tol biopolymer transport system component
LDDTHLRILPGTEAAYDPAFSPDGRWVAFITGDRLAKVPVEGGSVLTVADLSKSLSAWGIDWGTNDSIAISADGRIATIAGSATPGKLHWLTAPDSGRKTMHIWPRWSPDGRWLLYVEWRGSRANAKIVARSMRDGRMAPLSVSGIMPLGFIDKQLIYCSATGEFMAVPFDSHTGDTVRGPTQLGESAVGATQFTKAALSRSGSLAFMTGALAREIVGLDLAQGSIRPIVADRRAYTYVRMSPDGKRIAMSVQSATQEQISIYDLASRTTTRLSPAGIVTQRPEWTPDSKRVLYRSDDGDVSQLQWQAADENRAPEPLLPDVHNVWEGVLSPDGRTLAYRTGTIGNATIRLRNLDDRSAQPRSIGNASAAEWGARFSPDGHWLAYSSDRGGARQIFVERTDGQGSVVQVSEDDGADTPVWSPDGHKIFYMVNGERIVMATLDPGPPLRVLGRRTLVDGGYFLNSGHATFDVAAGGKELLLLKTVTSDADLVVAYNWREQVRARLHASASSQKR